MPTRSRRMPDTRRHPGWCSVVQVSALAIAVTIMACADSAQTAPSPPPPSSPPPSSPPPPITGDEKPGLWGVAYEHTPTEIRPLSGLALRVTGVLGVTHDAVTDAEGHYQIADLSPEYALVGVRPQDAYLSPCSAQKHQWASPLNVHVVSKATLLVKGTPQSMPPFSHSAGYEASVPLSGVVRERTSDGMQPVAEASVEHFYGDGMSGDPTGFTLTNAEGFFVVCGYWDDHGQSVRVSKRGYRTAIQPYGASTKIDFELIRD
jgi:hypothetical protein